MMGDAILEAVRRGVARTIREREGFAPINLNDERDVFDLVMNVDEEVRKVAAPITPITKDES